MSNHLTTPYDTGKWIGGLAEWEDADIITIANVEGNSEGEVRARLTIAVAEMLPQEGDNNAR